MPQQYEPPKQSAFGQFFDCIFLLALVYATLFTPLVLGLTGGGTTTHKPDEITWETLKQNPTMQAQWEKLGYTPETAAELITTKFDYTIEPISLGITALIIIAYFIFLITTSEKEFREVIREKFGL